MNATRPQHVVELPFPYLIYIFWQYFLILFEQKYQKYSGHEEAIGKDKRKTLFSFIFFDTQFPNFNIFNIQI